MFAYRHRFHAGNHADVMKHVLLARLLVSLARKDTPASYHLAVTLDDHLQGVTLVTRGMDLFPATHIHRLLQALLDLGRREEAVKLIRKTWVDANFGDQQEVIFYKKFNSKFFCQVIPVLKSLFEIVACINMKKAEWHFCRPECFLRKVH